MNSLKAEPDLIKKINSFSCSATPFLLLVDFKGLDPQLYTLEECSKAGIHFSFPLTGNPAAPPGKAAGIAEKELPSFGEFCSAFTIVQKHLHHGNSFLVNLTMQTPIDIEGRLQDLYERASSKYKILYKDEWLCFSPERFISIEGTTIRANPMKGTIDASIPGAAQWILEDEKETAEHYTIVDLIRNDLSMVAQQVSVNRFRYIDELHTSGKHLLQVSSEISGTLAAAYREQLGEILFTLLPAGSVSGAPKNKTMEIISEAENYERGFYTGVAFYFDGHGIDSCVLIRFIEKKKGQYVYKSGGGITIHSKAEDEYRELIDKIYVPFS